MASIRDLVGAIRQRDGVEAAVVLGRDGLLIDSQTRGRASTPRISRRTSRHHRSRRRAGRRRRSRHAAHDGARVPATGSPSSSVLSADAMLLVLVQPQANVGQLLFELRRNREQIAALV